MDFEAFKKNFTAILGEDAQAAVKAMNDFKQAILSQDSQTSDRLLNTMNTLITKQGRNSAKIRCIQVVCVN